MVLMKRFLIYWLPPLLWMAIISPVNDLLTTASTSSLIVPILKWLFPHAALDTIETIHILIRKVSHFLEYAFLAFLLFRAFRSGNTTWRLKWTLYAGLISVCYAALDEGIQTLIPSRTGSLYDWMIDSTGVVLMLSVLFFMNKKNRNYAEKSL